MIAILSVLLALPFAAQGRVVKTDGTAASGTVTVASLEKVTVGAGDNEVELAPSEVLSVSYGPSSGLLSQAEAFLDSLEFQNAVALFDEAGNQSDPAWVPVVAKLRRAEALLAWSSIDSGQASDAQAAFQDWLATYPDHFWVSRARLGLARAMGRAGDVDAAANELQELASFAFDKNLGKQVEMQARLTRCIVYIDGDQATLARQRLEGGSGLVATLKQAAASPESPLGLRSAMSKMWTESVGLLGEAVESIDGLSKAKSYWEGVLRSEKTLGVDAQANGQITIARAAREAGNLREAQFALAGVAATLNAGPNTMARALFTLGEICQELGDTPTPGATYFRRVVDDYPTSRWAIEARKKL